MAGLEPLAFLPRKAFMERAIALAKQAALRGEVPVGAVVVSAEGEILGEGSNRREELRSALAHAEIEAIHQACRALGDWRLEGCTLYVTLEPCPMCAGAAFHARLRRIVFGAQDEQAGFCGSAGKILTLPGRKPMEIYRGFCEEDCAALLSDFFRARREND